MTARELIEHLQQFDGDLPVRLTWSHGAEPGPVSDVTIRSYHDDQSYLEIRGEQP